jgi:hypothetical protein
LGQKKDPEPSHLGVRMNEPFKFDTGFGIRSVIFQ